MSDPTTLAMAMSVFNAITLRNTNKASCHFFNIFGNVISLSSVGCIAHQKFGIRSFTSLVTHSKNDNPMATELRTHTCGQLRGQNIGESVVLCGWKRRIRNFGQVIFIPLYDGHGTTQLVVEKTDGDSFDPIKNTLDQLKDESVVMARGVVRARAPGQERKDEPTGSVEVAVDSLSLLNECDDMPFPLLGKNDMATANHDAALAYRYLLLRTPTLQHNLRLRSAVARAARDCLDTYGFVEVETPTLFRSTPEGAREFIVPTREKGLCFALPQSPQQYKQLLMAGGVDRYFQFARCYRDEDLRADRQLEFTQIDLEMAYISQHDIQRITEALCCAMWKAAGLSLPSEFPSIEYAQAMAKYGTDKPDLRYGMEIADVTDIFNEHAQGRTVIGQPGELQYVGAVCVRDHGKTIKPKDLQAIAQFLEPIGGQAVHWLRCSGENRFRTEKGREGWGGIDILKELGSRLLLAPGDIAFVLGGDRAEKAQSVLGKLRLYLADLLLQKGLDVRQGTQFSFLWVDRFPLFTYDEATHTLQSTHHPFTAPVPRDLPRLFSDPTHVIGQHYDLVVNGWELGGGSIRIHNEETQRQVFTDILGVDPSGFSHLLKALRHGCPPHGGIALGFDRLMALLVNASSLRDVIAFPKSFAGREPMTNSPAKVSANQLAVYGLQLAENKLT